MTWPYDFSFSVNFGHFWGYLGNLDLLLVVVVVVVFTLCRSSNPTASALPPLSLIFQPRDTNCVVTESETDKAKVEKESRHKRIREKVTKKKPGGPVSGWTNRTCVQHFMVYLFKPAWTYRRLCKHVYFASLLVINWFQCRIEFLLYILLLYRFALSTDDASYLPAFWHPVSTQTSVRVCSTRREALRTWSCSNCERHCPKM